MIWFYEALASIRSFLELGGNVLYAIMLVLFLMWTFILERMWYIYRIHPREKRAIVDPLGSACGHPLLVCQAVSARK